MKRAFFLLLFFALLSLSLQGQENEECIDCHGDDDCMGYTIDGVEISMFFDLEKFKKSVHADLDCIDCHGGIDDLPHADDLPRVDCAYCHDEEQEEYAQSVHGLALKREGPAPASCADCHGKHSILYCDDPLSRVRPANVENICGSCHEKPEVIRLFGRNSTNPVALYRSSVHGRAMGQNPEKRAATCVSCHGSHSLFRKVDLRSSFADPNIPATCGACHEEEEKEYRESSHWFALQRGHYESPVCNDCHGGHGVESTDRLRDHSNGQNKLSELCRGCHSSEVLMERFGLDSERFDSYMKTYHALATRHGSQEAAACTSCHEKHAIRSQEDPVSSTHAAHLVETCGRCHESATESFARIPIHPVDQEERNPLAYWITMGYIYLIVLVIGGMILHNMVILFYFVRGKFAGEKKAPSVQRFRRFEVCQHAILIASFTVLAVTGFALKFPDAFWVRWLTAIGMTETVRSMAHRVGAVAIIAVSLIQMIYLIGTRSGWRDIRALIPTAQDIAHFVQNMKYHLRLSKKRPAFGRFDYMEKMEYLALIWGMIVMAVTGVILWFPEVFAGLFPWWAFETAEVIHFYEAILATLAIVFWHWFFVLYHPENYPMKLTFLHGKIPVADLKHHHPAEYAELKGTEESGKAEG
jgi:cytochrome b subunit of formate dehydrogenase